MTLFGNRFFAEVIKCRILRYNHPALVGWALNPMTTVLMRGSRGENIDGEEEKAM